MDVRMSVPENGTNRIWLRTLFGYVRSVKMTALKDYHMIISEGTNSDCFVNFSRFIFDDRSEGRLRTPELII